MKSFYRLVALALVLMIGAEHAALAIDARDAAYFGGTLTVFGNPKDPVEGRLDTTDQNALQFAAFGRDYAGKTFSIPYANIVDLEYGQKAGRRVGAAEFGVLRKHIGQAGGVRGQVQQRVELGTPEQKIFKNWLTNRYHAPSDDLSQPVDKPAAAKFNRIMLDLGMRVANNTDRPHWNADSFFKRFER